MKKIVMALAAVTALLGSFLLLVCSGMVTLPPRENAAGIPSETTPAERTAAELAADVMEIMTPEEKAWQLLVAYPQDVSGRLSTADSMLWAESLEMRPVGGFVISGENMTSPKELKAMLAAISGSGKIPALLCVDEEGGAVARLSYTLGVTTDFKPMFTYRGDGQDTAYRNARTIAEDIRDFGFNVDFAPVADVWTNPENTVIGKRAYSDDPAEAAKLVAAAVRGFHDGGVVATLKHFPGHGDTAEDSHFSAAYSDRTLSELETCEFLPFAAGIGAGADMVMVGHIVLTQIDADTPATLSYKVITGLLRETLGFDGVVITDGFQMAGMGERSEAEAAVLAIEAGCDIILGPADPAAVVQSILEQVEESRIDESVLRILTLKIERGILAAQ